MTKETWSYCVIELKTGGAILLRSKPTYWQHIPREEWNERGRSHWAQDTFEELRERYALQGWTCLTYRTVKHLPNGNNVGTLVVITHVDGRRPTREELIYMIDLCKACDFATYGSMKSEDR